MTPPAAAAPAVRARTAVPARPLRSAPRPRRVSGPATRKPASVPREVAAEGGVVLGALGVVGRISSHRLLDRLIRGRTWIAFVAFALIGIVTLQLGLLKLNAGIGRSLERSAQLQRENASLSIENSELAAGNRVEATAAHLGMQLVPAGSLRFLRVGSGVDVAKAAAALAAPAHSSTASSEQAASSSSSPSSTPTTSTTSSESSASTEPATTGEQGAGEAASPSSSATSTPSPSAAATPAAPTGESTAASGQPAAAGATSAPSTTPPSTAGAPEATPAGGTQAAPGG
jgi:cell division protein FtsL